MTIRYILDTDTVTYHQLGREPVIRRFQQLSPNEVATTIVTVYEQMRGRLAAINRKQSPEQLKSAFQKLQLTQLYFCRVPILAFENEAVSQYQKLDAQKLRIGSQDLRIAAITLAHNAVLVTSNVRHFGLVPNLKFEDWSQ
ncbi:MAG: type II toxin-antitoxin system VapC family toxin [Anaerolineae bacterium]|nr:type II toxin-antitoxin system VapC family toxin [Anaerolineae bacterium]